MKQIKLITFAENKMQLKEIQNSFADYFNHHQEDIKKNIAENPENLEIYSHNILTSLIDTLKNIYPVTEKLVGIEFFELLAKKYAQTHNSKSGNLDDYGTNLSEFILKLEQLKDLKYLSDIAKIEWLSHLASLAEEADILDLSKAKNLDKLRLNFNKSSHLVISKFPIHQIWKMAEGENEAELNLENKKGEAILIYRDEFKVKTKLLNQQESKFLKKIKQKKLLAEIFEEMNEKIFEELIVKFAPQLEIL